MAKSRKSVSDVVAERRAENNAATKAIVRATVKAVPGGSSALEIWDLLAAPVHDRRTRWMEEVDEALKDLAEKDATVDYEDLANDPRFVSTVLHASQIAERNHESEKLAALKNVVRNAAINPDLDADLRTAFIGLVDTITSWHIILLRHAVNPTKHRFGERAANLTVGPEHSPGKTYVDRLYPPYDALAEKAGDGVELVYHFWRDLQDRGLIIMHQHDRYGHDAYSLTVEPTAFGRRFFSFIEEH